MSEVEHSAALESILRSTAWLWNALRAVREANPPEWVITAGVIRNAVWDHLHGYTHSTPPRDVDVGFFDPLDLGCGREIEIEDELRRRILDLPWEARNLAAAHLRYEGAAGRVFAAPASIEDAVAMWPETATCVAVRLDSRNRLTAIAPFGLEDLLGMVLRLNPRHPNAELFARRVAEKRLLERWPRVTLANA